MRVSVRLPNYVSSQGLTWDQYRNVSLYISLFVSFSAQLFACVCMNAVDRADLGKEFDHVRYGFSYLAIASLYRYSHVYIYIFLSRPIP